MLEPRHEVMTGQLDRIVIRGALPLRASGGQLANRLCFAGFLRSGQLRYGRGRMRRLQGRAHGFVHLRSRAKPPIGAQSLV
jgi:hypothetical protein